MILIKDIGVIFKLLKIHRFKILKIEDIKIKMNEIKSKKDKLEQEFKEKIPPKGSRIKVTKEGKDNGVLGTIGNKTLKGYTILLDENMNDERKTSRRRMQRDDFVLVPKEASRISKSKRKLKF